MATTTLEKHNGMNLAPERTTAGRVYTPAVDIVELGDELLLMADVPGVRPEDVDLNFDNGELTLSAKVHSRQPETTRYQAREYGIGDFYRAFRIGETIDVSKIRAELTDGVLKVHLPKSEDAKPRKIAVKAG